MNWNLHTSIKSPPPPPPPPPVLESPNFENKISPSILLIIVILAVIFFISGLLHLLVRYLLRPTNRDPEDLLDNVTALQGQLQQLFHLHDSGVDQSFIDVLPVFPYKAIMGIKDPFDCAVCLCEFEADDKLRLLPKCSHAFHIECIDTWLLSHSTCPLCRRSLLPDFSPSSNSFSPLVLVLESGSESSREIGLGSSYRGDFEQNSHLGFLQEDDFGPCVAENSQKGGEIRPKEEMGSAVMDVAEAKVVQVKLGKFRNVDAGVGGGEGSSSGNGNLDQRRCFSMGSYEYVMNESSMLRVAIKPSKKKPGGRKPEQPGHRLAMSECDCHSKREGFKGFAHLPKSSEDDGGNARIGTSKRESFSISKIWLRNKKEKPAGEVSSRRVFSFRLPPLHHEITKAKSNVSPTTVSGEFEAARWEKKSAGSEMDLDVEVGSCNNSILSMGSQVEEAPSFARRTLMWIVGRQQNKVGSHV